MDMQGTPIGGTNQGTKNTSDPRASDAINENPGAIASDSLAAESTRSGGDFSQNPNSTPSGVSGSNSTFNTTDTSGATSLQPAPDAAEREAKAAWNDNSDSLRGNAGVRYPEGAGGQPNFPGQVSEQGYSGGTSADKVQTSATGFGVRDQTGAGDSGVIGSTGSSGNYGTGSSGSGGDSSNVDAAPGYIASVVSDRVGGPHGKNIQEGGFEGESKPGFAEPGSENDPGRAALNSFQNRNEAPAGGTGPRQSGQEGENPYETVGEERA